jgi:hypothetical protein
VDVETASALERVAGRIDTLETAVRGDIAGLDTRVDRLDGRFDKLEIRFDKLEARFDKFETSIRAEIEDVRRHAVVLNESTRDDIRMVAEAVAVLTVKVDEALRR